MRVPYPLQCNRTGVEQAKTQDEKTLAVWRTHPGHRVVHNKERDFEAKLAAAVSEMCGQLNV